MFIAYAGGFIGVAVTLVDLSRVNNMMMLAFSTIIVNIIPRSYKGKLYSLIEEWSITIKLQ